LRKTLVTSKPQTDRGSQFTGLSYLQKFALPNFFFHEVMAYGVLRNAGVPVGKLDYLGKDI